MKANFYLNSEIIATIDNIIYETPWLLERHHFFNDVLLTKLIAISAYQESDIWLNEALSEDEQHKQLDELQEKLGISDNELEWVQTSDWYIILDVDNHTFDGFPKIDSEWIEWR